MDSVNDLELREMVRASIARLGAARESERPSLDSHVSFARLPILASDLPVFKEVAGTHAYYFVGDASSLALAVIDWLALFERGEHPRSEKMPYLTWQQSAEAFKAALLGDTPQCANEASAEIYATGCPYRLA